MLLSCLVVSTQVPPAVELLLLGEEEARGRRIPVKRAILKNKLANGDVTKYRSAGHWSNATPAHEMPGWQLLQPGKLKDKMTSKRYRAEYTRTPIRKKATYFACPSPCQGLKTMTAVPWSVSPGCHHPAPGSGMSGAAGRNALRHLAEGCWALLAEELQRNHLGERFYSYRRVPQHYGNVKITSVMQGQQQYRDAHTNSMPSPDSLSSCLCCTIIPSLSPGRSPLPLLPWPFIAGPKEHSKQLPFALLLLVSFGLGYSFKRGQQANLYGAAPATSLLHYSSTLVGCWQCLSWSITALISNGTLLALLPLHPSTVLGVQEGFPP
ncbi:hypothetical protein Anapl_04657 [Anas platyrhynchos]|uniref:Uncharacterized protein n=1 Tax=Anas platyrhynchos TaxID=8839 RepID=R0LEG5_ANAPL|nr:hypothetical protein Anapl_04657 [Anas platyrhynchos]